MGGISAGMRRDDTGVTATVEYILTFIIASGIFALLIMNFNPLFVSSPQDIVTRNQLADIGNDVSTKIIDTYLILPDDGRITTYFDIPTTVAAGSTYGISIINTMGKNRQDRIVSVATSDGRIFVNTTLSGANLTIPISGNTSSTGSLHNIIYDTSNLYGVD